MARGDKAVNTGWRRLLMVLMLVFGGLTVAPVTLEAQSTSYLFEQVEVAGNSHVDAKTVLAFAKIPKGISLTPSDLNDIYQRIVASGLFETVSMEPSGTTLTIRVKEYPVINVVDIQGNKRVKDEDLFKILKSQSARVYSPTLAEEDAAAITAFYFTNGSQAATVNPVIIRRDDNRVDLVFEVKEGRISELERVNFVGNQSFSDYALRQQLVTRQAGLLRAITQRDTLNPAQIEADKAALTEFYTSRGFMDFRILDVSAVESRERDATFLTFTISEGQQFRVGQVATVSTIPGLDPAEFDRKRRLRSGVLYDPLIVENNVARMETYALKRGINFITVDPVLTRHDREGLVDVTFTIRPGDRLFIQRIDIEGNTTTLDQVIRRQFDTVEGDPFNPREIKIANDKIQALGFFESVQVSGEPGDKPDQVILQVDVKEKPTGSIALGATYGVADGFGLNLGYSETNFLGRGQALSLQIQTGADALDSHFNFTEPGLLGRDLSFTLNLDYLKTTYQYGYYDTLQQDFSPGINFPISEATRMSLYYKLANVSLSNVASESSVILKEEQGTQLESGIGYLFGYDSRRTGLDPDNVFLATFGQEVTGLGGEAQYVETSAYAMAQHKLPHQDVVLRSTFWGGWIAGYDGYGTRVNDRFFANNQIRGFAPNGIGPRDLTAANEDALAGNIYTTVQLDAEFPLGLPKSLGITGGAFLDFGSVWSLNDTQGTAGPVDDTMHPRAAVGVSILWKTIIGPLRFNFSHVLVKESYDQVQNFDLTISTDF